MGAYGLFFLQKPTGQWGKEGSRPPPLALPSHFLTVWPWAGTIFLSLSLISSETGTMIDVYGEDQVTRGRWVLQECTAEWLLSIRHLSFF